MLVVTSFENMYFVPLTSKGIRGKLFLKKISEYRNFPITKEAATASGKVGIWKRELG